MDNFYFDYRIFVIVKKNNVYTTNILVYEVTA